MQVGIEPTIQDLQSWALLHHNESLRLQLSSESTLLGLYQSTSLASPVVQSGHDQGHAPALAPAQPLLLTKQPKYRV